MKRRFSSVLTAVLAVCLLLSAVPLPGRAEPTANNNAAALVARGEEAFVKSDEAFSAHWIWNASDDGAGNRWMVFRKDVTLSEISGTVTAKISADSKYWLWINGQMAVFEGQLKRGAALLDKNIYPQGSSDQPELPYMFGQIATYYDEVDLTPYLRSGKNTITALVWYLGNDGHSHVGSGKGAFLFESQMGDQLVISDSSWKTSRHLGYLDSAKWGGYAQEYHINYDASAGFNDFYQPEFDVSAWEDAAEIGTVGDLPWNELWPRTIPEWKLSERRVYTEADTEDLTKLNATTYRLKLPTNIQFVPYLRVKAPAGKQIVVKIPNISKATVTYTTVGAPDGGAAEQEYESPEWVNWWYADFTIPEGVEVLGLGYRQTGYNTSLSGYFNCDDAFFNTLWTKARDTVYVNMRDTFMDCPDRERSPWLGDAVNEMQIAYYSMSPTVFDAVRKDISVRVNWQNADGIIPTSAPLTFRPNEYAELTGQSLAGVMSWFQYYLYSGDETTLRLAYPALLKYMELFRLEETQFTVPFYRKDGTNTVHRSWVDWGSNIDKDLCLNIWAYIGVQTVVKFAGALGDTETEARYRALEELMASKFDQTFWNGSEYRSSTYTGPADDRGQALAVYAGLVSADKYETVRDLLLTNQFASPYMVKYSIEALYLLGYPEAAEQRMKESYARDVPRSDPTFSENWGGGGTKNHGWSGGGLIALSGYAAGIRPLEAGYQKFVVAPQLGNLREVEAGVDSAKGMIRVKAVREESSFRLTANVPQNSTGLLGVPRLSADTAVLLGDTVVWNDGPVDFEAEGLRYSHSDFSHIYFEAEPGDWTLQAVPARKTEKENYQLTVPALQNGTVRVNGEAVELPYTQTFAKGTSVSVEAVAAQGWRFASFDGSIGSRASEIVLVMDADKTVRAEFEKIRTFDGNDLTVSVNGGFGKILLNEKEIAVPYQNSFEKDKQITLKAQPAEGNLFAAWRDAYGKVLSEEPELSFDMSEPRSYVAEFADEGGENLALGKTATASTNIVNAMFDVSKATDGVYTLTGQNEGWTSDAKAGTEWIRVDLGEKKTVKTIRLFPRNNGVDDGYGIPVDLEILTSENGEQWETALEIKDQPRPLADYVEYSIAPTEARFVKINGSVLRVNPKDGNRKRFQLAELEIYGETYDIAPEIRVQPESAVAGAGAEVTFAVTAVGKAPMDYQWQVSTDGGASFTDIERANQPRYTFTAKYAQEDSRYRCVITNPLGSVVTETASLNLISANYALKRPTTVRSNQTVGTTFTQAYLNDGVTLTPPGNKGNQGYTSTANTTDDIEWVCVDIGTAKPVNRVVIYPRLNGVDDGYGIPEDYRLLLSRDGIEWKTVLSVSGSERITSGKLTLDFASELAKYVKFEGTKLRSNPKDMNQRRLQIAELEVYNAGLPSAPVLMEDPQDVTAAEGETAVFTVSAIGGDRLSYRWQSSEDGRTYTDTEDGTGASLTVTASKSSHGKYFRCVLTDEFGTVTSAPARLYMIGRTNSSENYAFQKTVQASSTMPEGKYSREKLVDGITEHSEGINHGWMGDNTKYSYDHAEWVSVDMETPKTVNTIRIYPIMGDAALRGYGLPVHMKIYASENGADWRLLREYTEIPLTELYSDFVIPETTTRFIKVEGVHLRQNPNNGNSFRMAFAELEIYQIRNSLLPVITEQPADLTVKARQTAALTVTVDGSAAYQWHRLTADGTPEPIAGATAATYTFIAPKTADQSRYVCRVTNDGGEIFSRTALLTVEESDYPPLLIVTKPSRLTYHVGGELETEGLKTAVKTAEGIRFPAISDCRFTYDFSRAGKASVSVTYEDGDGTVWQNSFTVNVLPPVYVSAIAVASKPEQLVYTAGEELNTAGLSVLAKKSDGTSTVISEGFTVTGYDRNAVGVQLLTVTYQERNASFSVRVKDA